MFLIDVIKFILKKVDDLAKVVSRHARKLQKRVGNDTEQSIAEFERLCGRGHSDGRRFDGNEIHQR